MVVVVLLGTVAHGNALAQDDPSGERRPSIKLSGFSDVKFAASDDRDPDASSGFQEGQFVLHVVSRLSGRFEFFAELSLTARDSQYSTEVERGIIKFTYNDYLKVSAGRFHTPVNWWNNAFHHGQWLQTSIDRPEMTRFGGEFIPVHFVGAMVEGNVPSGPAHLGYVFGAGNGRGENPVRAGDAGDVNNNRALLFKVFSRPARPYRLEVGGSYYVDKVSITGLEESDEDLASLYIVWSSETPEVLGEYSRLRRQGEVTRVSVDSTAWYVQVAYRLPWLDQRLKPYARYERIDLDEADPVFVGLTDQRGYLVGLRADVASFVALKAEYRHQKIDGLNYDDAYFAQVSFAF